MTMAVRTASSTLGKAASFKSLLAPKNLLKAQSAGLISKALREPDWKAPIPFPYKTKDYGIVASIFDKTSWRLEENSKIIVVDGPVASGKAKVAKRIADEFDMLYIPHAHLDKQYVNTYGFDMRTLDDQLPVRMRSFDTQHFLANPNDERAANMQILFFSIRMGQYLDALSHVLNTGQGVVMNRSVYSDFVFLETYLKFGFLPQSYRSLYTQTWNCIRPDLMRPHLIVYLDASVDVVLKNLKKRNNPVEMASPAYQPEVLTYFEDVYKNQFLKNISTHAELLVYDWSEEMDAEIMVEDLERMNLDDYDCHNKKMYDWRQEDEDAWNSKRMEFSKYRPQLEMWVDKIPYYDCPEILYDGEDAYQFQKAIEASPGNKYLPGYNEDMGDYVLFKY